MRKKVKMFFIILVALALVAGATDCLRYNNAGKVIVVAQKAYFVSPSPSTVEGVTTSKNKYTSVDALGVGTVTFIKNNKFAAVAHCIQSQPKFCFCTAPSETAENGEIYWDFKEKEADLEVEKVTDAGVYGNVLKTRRDGVEMKTGSAEVGKAEAWLSESVGAAPEKYPVKILKIGGDGSFVLQFNNDAPIAENPAGFSGSPVIQNGGFVGAIAYSLHQEGANETDTTTMFEATSAEKMLAELENIGGAGQ